MAVASPAREGVAHRYCCREGAADSEYQDLFFLQINVKRSSLVFCRGNSNGSDEFGSDFRIFEGWSATTP